MQSLFLLLGGDYLKKILCITLALLLCLSSICTVYADSSDSDHGGTGGSIGDGSGGSDGDHGGTGGSTGMPSLAPVDPTIADQVVMSLLSPDLTGAVDLLNKYFSPDDMDEDTRNYIKDNAGSNVTSDGNYYYINQNFVQNINQKVQNRVHALDGYYLIDSLGSVDENTINYYFKRYNSNKTSIDSLTGNAYKQFLSNISTYPNAIICSRGSSRTFFMLNSKYFKDTYYLCLNPAGNIMIYDSSTSDYVNSCFMYTDYYVNVYNASYIDVVYARNFVGCLGAPLKIFYSPGDIRRYVNQGQQHYSPNLPNKTIKVPINYATIKPTLNLNFDIEGKLADEIQAQLDLNFSAWLDKLLELSLPSNPTPTPGTSGGGSGGNHGGTGGTLDPTPTPGSSDGDGFNSDAVNYLEKIYNWLTLFGESHGTFTKKVSEYLDENKGKLDEIIVAINALGSGKTETESNGCKYDFTALSDFMDKLWNASDEKFDTMIDLLEENNEYQQKLVTSLNEIKAILVTQTVLELFENRSSETANKAKDKFPTSLPWDIAMVVNAMAAEPQEIKINLPIEIKSLGIHEEIIIDLTNEEWEKLAKTCRYLLSILFILFMIHLSRKMFFSGGDD